MSASPLRPAVIFDRDGTLNIDHGYTHRPEDLAFTPGAPAAIASLNRRGVLVIVATNQSGVARGYFDENAVARFHARMQDALAPFGAHIDAFYYCPFHEEAADATYRAANHPDRKPNPGMIVRALCEWPIDPARCVLIGDEERDLLAARAAHIRGALYTEGALDALVEAETKGW
jgi:D-glycero-D-manno-heptose 1,7-bisphosphate phosphatase